MENFIEEFKKKQENYKSLDSQELLKLSDDEIFEAVLARTEKYDYYVDANTFITAPEPIQNILAISMLDAQVNNGGFNQFYFNGYLDIPVSYEQALIRVGLNKMAELINRAEEIYNSIKDGLPSKKTASIEEFSESYNDNPLNDLDDEYYELEEEFRSKAAKYIRDNISVF